MMRTQYPWWKTCLLLAFIAAACSDREERVLVSTEQGGTSGYTTSTVPKSNEEPAVIAEQCYEIEYAYLNEFTFAAGCDPLAFDSTLQCVMTFPNQLGCPYEDPVNHANTAELTVLEVLGERFTELGCVRQLACLYPYDDVVPALSECAGISDTASIGNGYPGICVRSEI